ncbi:MAG: biosynthetic peptidoglycan transglycosylase [Oligoflexus sp.]
MTTLIASAIGTTVYFKFQYQWNRLQGQLQKFGIQLDMDETAWSMSGLSIPIIEFAGNGKHMMIRNLHLSPSISLTRDTDLFGIKLSIEQIRFLATLQASQNLSPAQQSAQKIQSEQSKELIEKIIGSFRLFTDLAIDSISGEIHDYSGRMIYAIKDLSLQVSSQQGSIDYRLAQALYRGRIFLENLEGTFIFDSNSEYMPFLVANGSALEKNWQAKGHIGRDLKSLSIFVKNQGIPKEWSPLLADIIPNDDRVNYALRLRLQRQEQGATKFDIQFGSTNFMLQHEILAEQAIGPLAFRKRWSGKFEEQTGLLQVQGFLHLMAPDNKNHHISTHFELQKNDILEISDNDPWQLQVAMRPTPCDTIRQVLPRSLLGELTHFQTSGHFTFHSRIKIPPTNPESFVLQFENLDDNCQLQAHHGFFQAGFLKRQELPANLDLEQLNAQQRAFISPRFNKNMGTYLPLLFVAAEDTGFWTHNGIEGASLEAALRLNLQKATITVGGSTITMQTAKNLFLHPKRTIARKVQEILFAKYLEQTLSKQEILTTYANIIEYGPNLYGIQNAAQVFFGRHPHQLAPQQALYLAAILPSPKTYLINYCQRKLGSGIRERMRQIYERFDHLRPKNVPSFDYNVDHLGFMDSGTYAQQYCPMTIAKSLEVKSRYRSN